MMTNNQLLLLPALLLLIASGNVVVCADQPASAGANSNSECSREGEEKKLTATIWSTCHNGRYVPSACVADDGSKVQIGLTVHQRNYVYECRQTSISGGGNSLALHQTACLRQKSGKAVVVEPGQRVTDPPFIYECVRQASAAPGTPPALNPDAASSVALKAVACANNTSEIPDGGTVEMGGFTYNCTRQTGSLTDNKGDVFLRAKGCLYNRKEYPLDNTTIIGDFAYRCTMTQWPSSTLSFSVIGCAHRGRRYEDGEKYHVGKAGGNRVVMQCHNYNNSKWAATPIACVDDADQEHEIGDTWIDEGGPGDKRLKYIVECRGDAKGVVQMPIACVYQPNPGAVSSGTTINAGCMKKFTKPNTLVKCTESNDGTQSVTAELVTIFLNLKKEEDAATAAGLKYC